ncbi:MAG: hypothetical protein NT040_03425 [Bacteroidetes bacterium]|nr:hypothetical protein [Bacteroidota bacterium]
MKTTKILSILGFAMILTAAISVSAFAIDKKNDRVSVTPMINHHVNVNLSLEKHLCNVYLVEILDGQGRMVAPAKTFIPGVSKYDFYERGPASGARIAVLVLAPVYGHFSCDTELFTKPFILTGKFSAGETYRYDLFPQTQPNKE